ncbi:MAG: pyruvate, water dikinase [Actinobacteria bacterium]|nr:pyruvate, water dikinase [Actinomycetota bacterium]
MTHLTTAIVELAHVTDGRYGGKALGLAELRAAGFDVPAAFVLADADPDALPPGLEQRYRELAPEGQPVAVRSSAAGEDGVESSFAGQYDTVLDVRDYAGLLDAVRRCVASTGSERASAYQHDSGITGTMHLVVQEMVDARAAGVVFSADPVSARRDLAVVDAVSGLGEQLVDGSTTSDHYEVDSGGTVVASAVGDLPALEPHEVTEVVAGARAAEARWGRPLDLEWAIDRSGRPRWLQARPITTLPGDLSAMDSRLAGEDHVYTRCNIGEMMPGAFCPLTASVSGQAIEYAMQTVQVVAGFQDAYVEDRWLQLGYFSGHLFLNMTEGTGLSSGILGNSADQYSLSICGRVVDELVPLPPKSFPVRLVNTVRLTTFALTASRAIRRLDDKLSTFETPSASEPRALLAELDAALELYFEATLTHVRSSSRAAVPANVLEQTLVKQSVKAGGTEEEGRARASALLAGGTDVESAVMLGQLDDVVGALAGDAEAAERFLAMAPADAVADVRDGDGPTSRALRDFLARHGHRGYRELCLRDPSWGDDPDGLGTIMQAMLRARQLGNRGERPARAVDDGDLPGSVRRIARWARWGAAGREATKSRMVLVAHHLSRGYRLLGQQLAERGVLPDADLVFFFDRTELPALVDASGAGDQRDLVDMVSAAQSRRAALPFQQLLEFPDVSVGRPVPHVPQPPPSGEDGVIVGRPASSGVVEGVVRVASTVSEAQALQPGEVLVAPVTDVGWTPYFTLIAALVTDIGSSVSHGAVVAREYGLPCVVNTQGATRVLRTGDRVRVDGDRGTVTLLE